MNRTFMILVSGLILAFTVSAQTATSNWLQGKWEGTGYQMTSNSTWTMKLTAAGPNYSIEYPSLKCGGEWRLVSMNLETATFTERITYGKENCEDDGNVVVERLNDSQIAFRWSRRGAVGVEASAILSRTGKSSQNRER